MGTYFVRVSYVNPVGEYDSPEDAAHSIFLPAVDAPDGALVELVDEDMNVIASSDF